MRSRWVRYVVGVIAFAGVSWAGYAAKQGSGHPVIWIAGILLFFLPQAAVVIDDGIAKIDEREVF